MVDNNKIYHFSINLIFRYNRIFLYYAIYITYSCLFYRRACINKRWLFLFPWSFKFILLQIYIFWLGQDFTRVWPDGFSYGCRNGFKCYFNNITAYPLAQRFLPGRKVLSFYVFLQCFLMAVLYPNICYGPIFST